MPPLHGSAAVLKLSPCPMTLRSVASALDQAHSKYLVVVEAELGRKSEFEKGKKDMPKTVTRDRMGRFSKQ